MATFLVIRTQTGPEFRSGEPLERQTRWDEHAAYMDALTERGFFLFGGPTTNGRVPFAVSAESEEEIRSRLAHDPWHDTHLELESIEPWTIRLVSPSFGG